MTKKQRLLIALMVIGILIVVVGVVSAQGRRGDPPREPVRARNADAPGPGQDVAPAGYSAGNGPENCCEVQTRTQTRTQTRMSSGSRYIDPGVGLPPRVDGELPDEVVDAITAGIMDEYNAYLMYEAIMEQIGQVNPFASIQAAELQHIATWEFIFERYGVEIPAWPEAVEVSQFSSRAEACAYAAELELANLNLYDQLVEVVNDYPDITQVVTNLGNASEYNHLPALERCAGE